jgi:hypothetical protein
MLFSPIIDKKRKNKILFIYQLFRNIKQIEVEKVLEKKRKRMIDLKDNGDMENDI